MSCYRKNITGLSRLESAIALLLLPSPGVGTCSIQCDPSVEPTRTMEDQPESARLIESYRMKRKCAHACNATRTDMGLTTMQQQGHEIRAQAPELPWQACDAAKVIINTMHSANPDQDRRPTGCFSIHACKNMAHVHRPDGTFAGKISKSRTDILHQAFMSRTTLGASEVAANFAEAVCALLVRYKDGLKETEGNGTKLSNHWATPDPYMRALQEGLSLKVERFASPLNHSEYLDAYFSRYEEDASFGANVDAFSCRWTGPSQCNPEYESDAMDLAVRWALASATESKEPSLTAFVLPH